MNKKIKVKSIVPFDEENKENLKNMKFNFDTKRDIKIVNDNIGKGSRSKSGEARSRAKLEIVHLSNERRLIE